MPSFPIYSKCNNRCIMCTNNDVFCREKPHSLDFLLKRVERFHKGNAEFKDDYRDAFSITGGEPTLCPHLFDVINKINELFPGIRISCLTNGRILSYEKYAKALLRLKVNLELIIPIHGYNSKLHDAITRVPGSFLQAVKGIDNIYRFKNGRPLIEIRIVIHRLNYKFLTQITAFIKKRFPMIDRLVYIFFEIEGQACKNFDSLRLTYTQLRPYIDKLCKIIPAFGDTRFYHFPLCTLPSKLFNHTWRTLPDSEISFSNGCNACNLKEACLGIHKGYLESFGDSEFKPVAKNFNIKKGSNWHHPIISAEAKHV